MKLSVNVVIVEMHKIKMIIDGFEAWRTKLLPDESSILTLGDASTTALDIEIDKKKSMKD
jgi:hypothetical protein